MSQQNEESPIKVESSSFWFGDDIQRCSGSPQGLSIHVMSEIEADSRIEMLDLNEFEGVVLSEAPLSQNEAQSGLSPHQCSDRYREVYRDGDARVATAPRGVGVSETYRSEAADDLPVSSEVEAPLGNICDVGGRVGVNDSDEARSEGEGDLDDEEEEYDELGFALPPGGLTDSALEYAKLYQPKAARREARWEKYREADPKMSNITRLKGLLRKGVPDSLRGEVWCHCLGSQELRDANPDAYAWFVKAPIPQIVEDQILVDVRRTFPNNRRYRRRQRRVPSEGESQAEASDPPEGLGSLERVLHAYAAYDTHVAYCQSMNFVAALLLLFMDEDLAFWSLAQLTSPLSAGVYSLMSGAVGPKEVNDYRGIGHQVGGDSITSIVRLSRSENQNSENSTTGRMSGLLIDVPVCNLHYAHAHERSYQNENDDTHQYGPPPHIQTSPDRRPHHHPSPNQSSPTLSTSTGEGVVGTGTPSHGPSRLPDSDSSPSESSSKRMTAEPSRRASLSVSVKGMKGKSSSLLSPHLSASHRSFGLPTVMGHTNDGTPLTLNLTVPVLSISASPSAAVSCEWNVDEYAVKADGYYAKGMRKLRIDLKVLDELVKKKMPKLSSLFRRHGITSEVFSTEWYLCFFCTSLPIRTTLRVWDVLMLEGSKVLFRVALAVLKCVEAHLDTTTASFEEVMIEGKNYSKQLVRHNEVMKTALLFFNPFKRKEIEQLRASAAMEVDAEEAARLKSGAARRAQLEISTGTASSNKRPIITSSHSTAPITSGSSSQPPAEESGGAGMRGGTITQAVTPKSFTDLTPQSSTTPTYGRCDDVGGEDSPPLQLPRPLARHVELMSGGGTEGGGDGKRGGEVGVEGGEGFGFGEGDE
eukprot:GHVN01079608.1.p1 GENE.GHVN01079608.1~~GHVN01079608.1.p1  ORF type:complete len:870 (+),score=230.73 GHVN01079608.1:135-2744(+)